MEREDPSSERRYGVLANKGWDYLKVGYILERCIALQLIHGFIRVVKLTDENQVLFTYRSSYRTLYFFMNRVNQTSLAARDPYPCIDN